MYLSNNHLIYKDGIPIIEDIINEKENSAALFFPIEGERYFFVIYVNKKPAPTIDFVCVSPGNDVYLQIISEASLDDLLSITKLQPSFAWRTGDPYKGREKLHYKHNGFEVKPFKKITGYLQNKLDYLLDMLYPHKNEIIKLYKIARVEIKIHYFGCKGELDEIQFKPETLSKISDLKISLNILLDLL